MVPRRLVEAHRRDVGDLVRLAQHDLRLIVARYTDPEAARDALQIALPKLVQIYGSAAATVGADWYADLREAAKARGRFTPLTAELPDLARTDALAGWGIAPLFGAEPDQGAAYSLLAGGLQRIIANADRDTITGSSTEDRRCTGWTRTATGNGCNYCLDRDGEFYADEPEFSDCHDHCQCMAVPGF